MINPIDASRTSIIKEVMQLAMTAEAVRIASSPATDDQSLPPSEASLPIEAWTPPAQASGPTLSHLAPPPAIALTGGGDDAIVAMARDLVRAVATSGLGQSAIAADLTAALGRLQNIVDPRSGEEAHIEPSTGSAASSPPLTVPAPIVPSPIASPPTASPAPVFSPTVPSSLQTAATSGLVQPGTERTRTPAIPSAHPGATPTASSSAVPSPATTEPTSRQPATPSSGKIEASTQAVAPPMAPGSTEQPGERARPAVTDVIGVEIATQQAQELPPAAISRQAVNPSARPISLSIDEKIGRTRAPAASARADSLETAPSRALSMRDLELPDAALADLDSVKTATSSVHLEEGRSAASDAALQDATLASSADASQAPAERIDEAIGFVFLASAGDEEKAGTILPSAILNAAMIPGWPRPAARDSFGEKPTVRKDVWPQDVALSDAELAAYLVNFGLDEQVLRRLKAAQVEPDGLPKTLTFLATLMNAAASVLASLRGEISSFLEELAALAAARENDAEPLAGPGARRKLHIK